MVDGKANILIVDDRPDKLMALEAVLGDLGENLVHADSGREALRQVLAHEFAVILLDVNMPGMDGFETAQLIRQRKAVDQVPIIFITAFGDDIHISRGYSLGAVDYILTPIIPEVLRTKVGVFVELFKKTQQLRRQAEWQRRRALQLQKLAAASVAINSAQSIERMLQTITDSARDIVGSHQAITLFLGQDGRLDGRATGTRAVSSFSDAYADWRDRPLRLETIANTVVARSRVATRLTAAELRDHPDWEIVRTAEIPPINGGMLAAPLTGRDGTNLGVIYLSDRFDGDFTSDDEAILVQLAQMAAVAIENVIYSAEREANRIKDEFLATLSHELRTPLNAILGWAQLLRMEQQPPEDVAAADASPATAELTHGLSVIERNAKAQAKLVEDLLDVSRITSGKLRLNLRAVSPASIVQGVIDAVRPSAEAKGITIVPAVAPGIIAIPADPDRLQQVVWNLLSNAVKFTPAGGRVEVRLELANGGADVLLRVIDNGRGIHPRFLPHVFDRFRQADSSSTRQHGGLGIGLTIVRRIVELHGGSVHAESPGENLGATFTVRLPTAVPGTPSAADAAATGSDPNISIPVAAGGPAPDAAADLTELRVMVVDDEADAREVVGELLRRRGAVVTTASSTREALEQFARARPDVLVSDIGMPHEDGYALLRRVRDLGADAGGDVPAVALTAYAREDDRQRALSSGFQAHLAKPVDPTELAATIANLAARKGGRFPRLSAG